MVVPRDLPSDPAFASQIEQAEVEAWLDLDTSFEGARQIDVRKIDGAVVLLDPSRALPRSRVLNLGVIRPATPGTVRAIVEAARAAGVTSLSTDVSPIARPGTLVRFLTDEGFVQNDRSVVVARHAEEMSEPDSYFRIRRAVLDDAATIVDLMTSVMPTGRDLALLLGSQVAHSNWHYYLANEAGVDCGLAGIHIHGDIAWLAPVWVLEAYRNRGTQSALIAHAVRDAHEAGAQWVTANYPATIPRRPRNFERLGFSMLYQRRNFVWTAEQS